MHDYPILIGLGGRKESGKDTVADFLAAADDVVKIGMSDSLHETLLTLDPWVYVSTADEALLSAEQQDALYTHWAQGLARYSEIHAALGYTEMKKISEVRRLLQVMGTEVGRDMISPTLWADLARAKASRLLADGTSAVLTGIRFANELWLVRELGGVSVFVERAGLRNEDSHRSETEVGPEDFDVVLDNDGTLDDLRTKTLLLMDTVLTIREERSRA